MSVLTSRKFWASLISMAVVFGALDLSDAAQAETAATIAAGVWAVYTLAVALEDGLSRKSVLHFTASDVDDEDR